MVTTIADAVDLVRTICLLPGNSELLGNAFRGAGPRWLRQAIRERDTPALYDWLITGFSFQGISDRIAADYIDRHGNASWAVVEDLLGTRHCRCEKLTGFAAYRDCGYRKTAQTCRNPAELPNCPVPALPLRRGGLNQLAVSLYLFLRDICHADLVGFIDQLFAEIDGVKLADPIQAKHDRLMAEFGAIHAVSAKLIAMMIGSLLMAGGSERRDWQKVGRTMVTIDSLLHNFFHRTGILAAFDLHHQYGHICFSARGCAGVIYQLADRIDARIIDASYPRCFPRQIEVAIWTFCAESQLDICNGRHIDDRFPCARADCPVGGRCSRLVLHPAAPAEDAEAKSQE